MTPKSSTTPSNGVRRSIASTGILVTGGTGLVGLEVVRALVRCGVTPLVLARGQSAGSTELQELERSGRVRFLRGDLTQGDVHPGRPTWPGLAAPAR